PVVVDKSLQDFFNGVVLENGVVEAPAVGSVIMVARDPGTKEIKTWLSDDVAYNIDSGSVKSTPDAVPTEAAPMAKIESGNGADTSKVWETSIIPNAKELGGSTGAGITFYLDETFEKVPKEMDPNKIEVNSEDKFKAYGEYMIYLNLKNAGSDLASGDFDSYLKKVTDKQKNGEKPTWKLMAVDTKTLKPVEVDVPISEISYTGKLANNTLKINSIKGGAEFDILFAEPSFYKLHPLNFVNSSGNFFEKAGIFVDTDNPTKIMMVDVMSPGKNGDIGLWYNGKLNNGDLANQVQKLFGFITLKPDLSADILAGKVDNLNAGGGKVKLYSGIYDYPFWTLLLGTAPKDFKNIHFTLSIS
ncbi:MAG TPA: hypothetical protein VLE44_02135, partial [Candidatus Saccharimonadales bacterium]|nr:hypothetical protein [Candidatus Saccharimonadales bacterium]